MNAADVFDTLGLEYQRAWSHQPALHGTLAWFAATQPSGSRVLDIGCGTGVPVARTLAKAGMKVTGLDVSPVMVDIATPLIRQVASPEAVAKWDDLNRRPVPEAPEAVMLLDAFAKIDTLPPLRPLPTVVLRADKPWQPPSAPKEDLAAAGVTFVDWQAAEEQLAAALDAKLITETRSGHNIYAYSPALVIDAVRAVVDAVRSGATRLD